jgi:flagellar biosynthesis/type III secretory pathway M-ring protein FliF/YscJ
MIKLKAALKWLKEKWWLPLSGAVIVLLTVVLSPRSKDIFKTLEENRELQNEEKDVVNTVNETFVKKSEEVRKQTKQKIRKLKEKRVKKRKEYNDEFLKRVEELAQKSNDELAEMLKKDSDEI